jgi:diguanylate cyclase (GGDEF)-like protein/putative nucleotidyltransferase with HDIG domain
MSSWDPLPLRVKAHIVGVICVALPSLIWAVSDILIQIKSGTNTSDLIIAAVLTTIGLITVPIFVLLPHGESLVTIGDAFVMAICMMCGTGPAILANALYMTYLTVLLRKKTHTSAYRIIFNIAVAIINVALSGIVYHLLAPNDSFSLESILVPAFGLSLTFFFSNSLLVATAIALSSNSSIFEVWNKNYLPLSLDFLVAATAGTSIALFKTKDSYLPLLAAPFLAAIWGINKINRAKAIDAKNHLKEQEQLYLRTVESLALAVDAKDQTTYGHIRRVRVYALGLAKLCGIADNNELMAIETGSLLHDIGKLAVEDYILNKPGKLSKQEFEKMKLHSEAGDEILQQIKFPFPVSKYVRNHHERWDGKGYPDGLKGQDIPLGARILAIADAFDAIRSSRPYKLSFGLQDSIELLRAQAGVVYDPYLIDLFVTHLDELETEAQKVVQSLPELSFRKYFEKVERPIAAVGDSLPPQNHVVNPAELVQLFEFCNSLGRYVDLSDILPTIVARIERMVPFTTFAIYADNGNDSLGIIHASGKFAKSLKGTTISMGKGISGWVAAYKRPIVNTAPSLDFQGLPEDFTSLTDALIAPLLMDGICVGTISLYAQPPIKYDHNHLDLVQIVASALAPLIAKQKSSGVSPETREIIDPITGTYRIAYLAVMGSQLVEQAEKNKSPLTLLCLDVKSLSQTVSLHGSGTGDMILRKVAECIKAELRETDVVVRYGYNGFAALLPGVRSDQAFRCAQRLQQQIRNASAGNAFGQNVPIECQTAVASHPSDGTTIFALLQNARLSMTSPTSPARTSEDEAQIIEFPPRY